jgi:hypothetical protein
MGQLQALSALTLNGSSLLSQVKALSTVSGGSWVGVPFEFLPANGPADTAFLGVFSPNIGSAPLEQLAILPPGNVATPITNLFFAPPLLALQAVLLYEVLHVSANMIWQTIIGFRASGRRIRTEKRRCIRAISFSCWLQRTNIHDFSFKSILIHNSNLGVSTID